MDPILYRGKNDEVIFNGRVCNSSVFKAYNLRLDESWEACEMGLIDGVAYIEAFDLFDNEIIVHEPAIEQKEEPYSQIKGINKTLIKNEIK